MISIHHVSTEWRACSMWFLLLVRGGVAFQNGCFEPTWPTSCSIWGTFFFWASYVTKRTWQRKKKHI
uniref:Secreted protein n=1 Tax=Hippocampus comes TaxID=109280 RepID=A0A3Q3DX57_HIPCM